MAAAHIKSHRQYTHMAQRTPAPNSATITLESMGGVVFPPLWASTVCKLENVTRHYSLITVSGIRPGALGTPTMRVSMEIVGWLCYFVSCFINRVVKIVFD